MSDPIKYSSQTPTAPLDTDRFPFYRPGDPDNTANRIGTLDGMLAGRIDTAIDDAVAAAITAIVPINLPTDVTGRLLLANLLAATGASKLLGRGSAAGGGDFQEITLGSGLTLTGTVLSATGGGGVSGPGSSTDRAIATWNGTGGATLRNTPWTIDATGILIVTGAGTDSVIQINDGSGLQMELRADGVIRGNYLYTKDFDSAHLGIGEGLRLSNATSVAFSSDSHSYGTADTDLKRSAAGVVKVGNAAGGYGTIDAGAYKSSGTAGIDFSGAVTSVTVVKGIVTAAS